LQFYRPSSSSGGDEAPFSLFLFSFVEGKEIIINFLKKNNFKIFGSLIESSNNIDEIDFNSKCAVIMGTEADSISSEFIKQSNECFKIPMTGNVDSLNLSVSTGIILYEVMNQRKSINFSR
jgi:23S rRNA (guanosine2251-2'-O)-methyltransferase